MVAFSFTVSGVVKAQTPKEVREYIYKVGFTYPDIVYQQYIEESGRGKSNLAVNSNNFFGMKYPYKRLSLSCGKTTSGFSVYEDWKDSVMDRLILDYYNGWHKLSKKTYLEKMRKIYCKNCKNYLVSI